MEFLRRLTLAEQPDLPNNNHSNHKDDRVQSSMSSIASMEMCKECPKEQKFAIDDSINDLLADLWQLYTESIPPTVTAMPQASLRLLANYAATYTKHQRLGGFQSSSDVHLLNNTAPTTGHPTTANNMTSTCENNTGMMMEVSNESSPGRIDPSSLATNTPMIPMGYPLATMTGLTQALHSLRYTIAQNPQLFQLTLAQILEYWRVLRMTMRHFEGLSKPGSGNAHAFWEHGILLGVVECATWAWSVAAASSDHNDQQSQQSDQDEMRRLAFDVVVAALEVVQNCLDPGIEWKGFLSTFANSLDAISPISTLSAHSGMASSLVMSREKSYAARHPELLSMALGLVAKILGEMKPRVPFWPTAQDPPSPTNTNTSISALLTSKDDVLSKRVKQEQTMVVQCLNCLGGYLKALCPSSASDVNGSTSPPATTGLTQMSPMSHMLILGQSVKVAHVMDWIGIFHTLSDTHTSSPTNNNKHSNRASFRIQLLAMHLCFTLLRTLSTISASSSASLNATTTMGHVQKLVSAELADFRALFSAAFRKYLVWIQRVYSTSHDGSMSNLSPFYTSQAPPGTATHRPSKAVVRNSGFMSDEESYVGINAFPFVSSIRALIMREVDVSASSPPPPPSMTTCIITPKSTKHAPGAHRAHRHHQDTTAAVATTTTATKRPVHPLVQRVQNTDNALLVAQEIDSIVRLCISYAFLDLMRISTLSEQVWMVMTRECLNCLTDLLQPQQSTAGTGEAIDESARRVFGLYTILYVRSLLAMEPFGSGDGMSEDVRTKLLSGLGSVVPVWNLIFDAVLGPLNMDAAANKKKEHEESDGGSAGGGDEEVRVGVEKLAQKMAMEVITSVLDGGELSSTKEVLLRILTLLSTTSSATYSVSSESTSAVRAGKRRHEVVLELVRMVHDRVVGSKTVLVNSLTAIQGYDLLLTAMSLPSASTEMLDLLMGLLDSYLLDKPSPSIAISRDDHALGLLMKFLDPDLPSKLFDWSLQHLWNVLTNVGRSHLVGTKSTAIPTGLGALFSVPTRKRTQEWRDRVLVVLCGLQRVIDDVHGSHALLEYVGDLDLFSRLCGLLESSGGSGSANGQKLVENALLTIRCLLAGHEGNKQLFKSISGSGYKFLADYFSTGSVVMTDRILDMACALMLDLSGWTDQSHQDIIRNPDAIELPIRLFPILSAERRIVVLNRLVSLALQNRLNLISVQSVPVKDLIFDVIWPVLSVDRPEELESTKRLLVILSRFNCTIKDVASLISFLKPTKGEMFASLHKHIVDVLRESMELAPDDTKSFFAFTGFQSGLLIPASDGYFTEKGYTISIKICFRSLAKQLGARRSRDVYAFNNPNLSTTEHKYLFSFADEDKQESIALYYHDGQLIVELTRAGVTTMQSSEFEVSPHRWHILSLTHQQSRKLLLNKPELVVYLDSNPIIKTRAELPKTMVYSDCSVGGLYRRENSRFEGSIDVDVNWVAMFRRGIEAKDVDGLVKGTQFPSDLMIYLHADAVNVAEEYAVNLVEGVSKSAQKAPWKNVLIASRLSTMNALFAAGGIDVFLGLIKTIQDGCHDKDTDLASTYFAQALDIMSAFVCSNRRPPGDQPILDGFSIMASMLRRTPELLSPAVVDSIFAFLQACSGNATLTPVMEDLFIFDLKLWIRTSISTQLRYLEGLKMFVSSHVDRTRMKYGIRWVMDGIQHAYSRPENISDIASIRRSFREILFQFIRHYINPKDLEIVLSAVVVSQNQTFIFDFLRLFEDLITGDSGSKYCEVLLSVSGQHLENWRPLFSLSNQEIQMKMLQFLGKWLAVHVGLQIRVLGDQTFICWMTDALSVHQPTPEVFNQLLSLCSSPSDPRVVKYPVFLHVAIGLFERVQNVKVVEQFVDSVVSLIKHAENWKVLTQHMNWLPDIVGLIVKYDLADERNEDADQVKSQLYSFIVSMYTMKLQREDCWLMVEDAAILLWMRRERHLFAFKLIHQFCSLLLRDIANTPVTDFQMAPEQNNLFRLMGVLEELLFYHSELCTSVKRIISTKEGTSRRPSILPQMSSLASIESTEAAQNPWEEGDFVQSLTKIINTRLDILASPDEATLKGAWRIYLRILLWGIMSPRHDTCAFSAKTLKRLLSQNLGKNDAPGHLVHFKNDVTKEILYLVGTGYQAYQASKSFVSGPPDELLDLMLFMMNSWKVHLSAYITDISGSLTQHDDMRRLLDSEQMAFAYDLHMLDAAKLVEEELSDISGDIIKRFETEVKVVVAKLLKRDETVAESRRLVDESFQNWTRVCDESRTTERSAQLAKESREEEKALHAWAEVSHKIYHPVGVWSVHTCDELRWLLDPSEDSLRMRKKLSVNYDFNAHMDASTRRDKSDFKPEEDLTIKLLIPDRLPVFGKKLVKQVSSISVSSEVSTLNEPEEWDLMAEDDSTTTSSNAGDEKFMFGCDCQMIFLMSTVKGRLEISNQHVSFLAEKRADAGEFDKVASNVDQEFGKSRKWSLDQIAEIHARRYLLQRSAIELFFHDRTTAFFVFSVKERNKVFAKLVQASPKNLVRHVLSPTEQLKKSNLTDLWMRGGISNFEYLMSLNTLAGRTYNDLTQYPVFPWILADYDSNKLDLNDPSTYRDLSKPVGALNPERLKHFIDRYNSIPDSIEMPKFHYGTHYSSAATVLFYLLRLEPFTSLHIALQNGRFDHSDRQFHSIAATWKSCLENTGDVKELTPEFFYMAEFLENQNGFDLGVKQTQERMGNVILPPWAEQSPDKFIRMHRMALESDYVSEHLHEWIDLIFGYKQRGEEAIKAHNLFYYLTYEGAVRLDRIANESERASIEAQINNFGQTPSQLFDRPHPKRLWRRFCSRNLIDSGLSRFKSYIISARLQNAVYFKNVQLADVSNRWCVVTTRGVSSYLLNYESGTGREIPFTLEQEESEKSDFLSSPVLHGDLKYAVSRDGKYLYVSGFWDGQIRMFSLLTGTLLKAVAIGSSRPRVTCMALSQDDRFIMVGRYDSIISVFTIEQQINTKEKLSINLLRHLTGHRGAISLLEVDGQHNLIVSACDTTILLWSLSTGELLRELSPLTEVTNLLSLQLPGFRLSQSLIPMLKISPAGTLAVVTDVVFNGRHYAHIFLHSLNGRPLCHYSLTSPPIALEWSQSTGLGEEVVLVSGSDGVVTIISLHDTDVGSSSMIRKRLQMGAPVPWLFSLPSGLAVGGIRNDGSFCIVWPIGDAQVMPTQQ